MSINVDVIYGTADPVPYTSEEVRQLQFAQSADVLFITHPNHPPATLSRYADDDWRYEQPVFRNGPYLEPEEGDDGITLSLAGVAPRMYMKSSQADFSGASSGDLVEYPIADYQILAEIVTVLSTTEVIVRPFEERIVVLSREVYSPGLYSGWNATTNRPTYASPIAGTGVTVAFSAVNVITRSVIGNYLRFSDRGGAYYWMLVDSAEDILEQGAYGILAGGDILTVIVPAGRISKSAIEVSATLFSDVTEFFDGARDIGRWVRLVFGTEVLHAQIVSVSATNQAEVSLDRVVPLSPEGARNLEDNNTNDWRLGAWYVGNYPATVSFHEERLGFGGSNLEPQTAWLSRSAQFYDFAGTDFEGKVLDDSAITFTLSSDTVNQILWMSSRLVLVIGTVGGEWQIGSGSTREALTALNISASQHSAHGSEYTKAVIVGRSHLYLQKAGDKLREMSYDFSTDAQVSLDLSVFAEHILRENGGAIELAYQQLPESVVYALCANGLVCGLTYEPDQKVYSWFRVALGGPQGAVTSISCKIEGRKSYLYMAVQRWINGAWVYTIERLDPEFEPVDPTDFNPGDFLDGAVNVPLSSVAGLLASGLELFAGESVTAVIDGVPYYALTVTTAGELTLPVPPAETLVVGYPYTSTFKSFPLEAPAARGSGQMKIKRINHVVVRVKDSAGFSLGADLDTLEEHPAPEQLESGDVKVPVRNGFDTRAAYYIVQSRPYPLTIQAVNIENNTSDS